MIGILLSDNPFYVNVIVFLLLAVALLFSIVLHEVAHGLVAYWNGDNTAKVNGRLSLNPLRHFDPIGAVMILLVGFGYARPVPVNPYKFRNYRRGCILVSIAGVTTNIIIAFFSSGLYVLFNALAAKHGSIGLELLELFFYYLSRFNVILCFFNLLPLFPLDGFNLIKALCKRENGFIRFMQSYGQYILIALILVSLMVSNLPVPDFFSPLDLYFNYTAGYVNLGFTKFWWLIFGGI